MRFLITILSASGPELLLRTCRIPPRCRPAWSSPTSWSWSGSTCRLTLSTCALNLDASQRVKTYTWRRDPNQCWRCSGPRGRLPWDRSGYNHVDLPDDALGGVVKLVVVELQLRQRTVHRVHEEDRRDPQWPQSQWSSLCTTSSSE